MRPKLIGLAGAAGSGKDTVAAMLVPYGYQLRAFAKPLKDALNVLGIEEPSTREAKEALLPGRTYSFRKAAQTLGTEWARGLDVNFWVNHASDRLIEGVPTVFTDIRFPEEAKFILEKGGVIWKLQGRETTANGQAATHLSEKELDRIYVNRNLLNDSTIKELAKKVKQMMRA